MSCFPRRFYAKLAELRQRIRANSLPVLHAGAAEPGSTGPGGNTDSNSAMNLSATNQMKHCDIIRQVQGYTHIYFQTFL